MEDALLRHPPFFFCHPIILNTKVAQRDRETERQRAQRGRKGTRGTKVRDRETETTRHRDTKKTDDLISRLLLLIVGIPGFEPGTPCSQSRCANRTALHPESSSVYEVQRYSKNRKMQNFQQLFFIFFCIFSLLCPIGRVKMQIQRLKVRSGS